MVSHRSFISSALVALIIASSCWILCDLYVFKIPGQEDATTRIAAVKTVTTPTTTQRKPAASRDDVSYISDRGISGSSDDSSNDSYNSTLKVVPRDEFMLSEDKGFLLPFDFDFTPPEENGEFGVLESLYQCSAPNATLLGRSKKLIFTHIIRTAGSTVRTVLEEYAKNCHAGIATIFACVDLSWESARKDYWKNEVPTEQKSKKKGSDEKQRRCILQQAINRTGHYIQPEKKYVFKTIFLEKNIDIITGHVPLGSHIHWHTNDDPKKQDIVDAQYVTFFRNPIDKFISTVMFSQQQTGKKQTRRHLQRQLDKIEKENDDEKRSALLDSIVSSIKQKVTNDTLKGLHYEAYTRSMITPEQKAWILQSGYHPTPEERVNLALSNIVNYKVLIGITEYMSESMDMLKYLIDRDGEVTNIFESLSYPRQSSILNTSHIVDELKKDDSFFELLQDYLKYEILIYSQVEKLHHKQYKWLQQQQGLKQ